ncbi:MAG: tyrosine-type recombinase/integrase [Flavobacterium sp.]|nr:tyrosine-type recombinase/integrase [Flavobacterium sp.]
MKKVIQTSAYKNLYNEFESFVRVRNYKQGRGKMYQGVVSEFLMWLEEKGITKIQDVNSEISIQYFDYLISRPKQRGEGSLSSKSIKFHLFVLGLFILNLLETNQIEKAFYIPSYSEVNENPRNVLSIDEVQLLYNKAQNQLETALLSLAYGCGLRRSEIHLLDVRDIQLSKGMLTVRKGKNGKRRDVPISDSILEYLKKYILEERYQKLEGKNQLEEAFFINSRGQRMSGEHLNEILKKMIEQTNNYELIQKEITLHCLRHSIAYHLAQNNAGIDFIRRFLGHSEINTTYLYAIKNKKRKPVTNF